MANRAEQNTVQDDISNNNESLVIREENGGEQADIDEAALEEAQDKLRREREARAQALTLEIVGDLPYAEVKPPENVLFVCKLNPVTEGQSLLLLFVNQCIDCHPQMMIWTSFLAGLGKFYPAKSFVISALAIVFNTHLSNSNTRRIASRHISKCKEFLLMITGYTLIFHKAYLYILIFQKSTQ